MRQPQASGEKEIRMNIFISHAHTERELAEAWRELLTGILPGVQVFYSSQRDPQGGIGAGRWRDVVLHQLQNADRILVLLTPQSVDSPWVLFEYGYARGLGQDDKIFPVLYWIDVNDVPSPVQDLQVFRGDRPDELSELAGRISTGLRAVPAPRPKKSLIEAYAKGIEASRAKWIDPLLFRKSFHNEVIAKQLEGDWFAKWTVRSGTGEAALPLDVVRVIPTPTGTRFRMVARPSGGAETALEGVVSSRSHVVLCWWAGSGIQACGTATLEILANNRMMEGTWEGFATFESPFDQLSREAGRIVLGRDRLSVEQRWGIASGSRK
jgi:hypothetical protein